MIYLILSSQGHKKNKFAINSPQFYTLRSFSFIAIIIIP
jgi:hypothetical protein